MPGTAFEYMVGLASQPASQSGDGTPQEIGDEFIENPVRESTSGSARSNIMRERPSGQTH